MSRLSLAWLPVLLLLLLAACTTVQAPHARQAQADALAVAMGWQASRIPAGPFELVAYAPRIIQPAGTLSVYIEGDGFAWVSGSTPSADPTPREPIALKLALAHPAGNAAYLARPCQYVDAERSGCAQHYWTRGRFAPEAIEAADLALDALKIRFGARQLVLVGYSGGGAVAVLLAARRDDVVQLVTVAGVLDHREWTAHHGVEALSGSLNAADVAERLARLPQIHFVGGKDRVIPPELAQRWPRPFAGLGNANLRIIPGFDHLCCWAEQWPSLFPVN